MELSFGRSRRRAALRRERQPTPRPNVPRPLRVILLGLTLFAAAAVLGESGALDRPANASKPRARAECPIPESYADAFRTAARDARVPLPLLVSVAYAESRMDVAALSGAGAQGLLQVMPETARELRLDPNVPEANILAGARYLRRMLDRFGDPGLALAAYNAGPTAVERAGGAPTLGTLNYVANVRSTWRDLRGCK